jgi:hypothetical protein
MVVFKQVQRPVDGQQGQLLGKGDAALARLTAGPRQRDDDVAEAGRRPVGIALPAGNANTSVT